MAIKDSRENLSPLKKLTKKNEGFSTEERKDINTLIVDPDEFEAQALSESLKSLGFAHPHIAKDHSQAVKIFKERNFSHTLFSAETTSVSASEYISTLLSYDPSIIGIATSKNSQVDDVFSILQSGALWFLALPCSEASLDESFLQATKGEGFSKAFLFASDRNVALSALIAADIDRAADLLRASKEHKELAGEANEAVEKLHSAAKLSDILTSHDSSGKFGSTLMDFFTSLGQGPASRLGRLRKRLKNKRGE